MEGKIQPDGDVEYFRLNFQHCTEVWYKNRRFKIFASLIGGLIPIFLDSTASKALFVPDWLS